MHECLKNMLNLERDREARAGHDCTCNRDFTDGTFAKKINNSN